MGRAVTSKPGQMVTQPTADFYVSGSSPAGWTAAGGATDKYNRPGFGPLKRLRPAALPFGHDLHCWPSSSLLLKAESATDNKPKLCVSV